MASDIEFDFGDADAAVETEDSLESGRSGLSRIPVAVWITCGVLVLIGATVAGLARGHHSPARSATPTASPSATPASVAPAVAVGDLWTQLSPLAIDPLPPGEVRPSSFGCPQERIAYPPTPAQLTALQRAFPELAEIESRLVIDGSSGLCAIQIRAHDDVGDVLVVVVVAPPNPRTPTTTSQQHDQPGAFTSFIGTDYTSAAGFHVQDGLFTSAAAGLATPAQLTDLAMDPGLTW
jgi:hypothetical protein